MSQYAQGGYIPGGTGIAFIHPDECLISPADVKAGRWICSRADHPTDSSDCGDDRIPRPHRAPPTA